VVFSSIEFLYYFLPISVVTYLIVPRKFKNVCLLVFSYVFYAFGEPVYIVLMLFSTIVDYVNGLIVEKYRGSYKSKLALIASLVVNIGILAVFKYFGLIVSTINLAFNLDLPAHELALPIGISFYTFQTMSYTIDVFSGRVKAQRNFITFACYVSLFPQLIAGPIVRYKDIAKQLISRRESVSKFSEGIERFVYGLGKKVLIANNVGLIAEQASSAFQTSGLIWIYVFAYGLQIYFDFSGYSDMAIGLGKMFGFDFKENFNYPYISRSITEFWRRWHMSLSKWFRDYLYIPLGGNRVSLMRLIFNIMFVWMITGLWHGADYNFIIWGAYFGIVLIIEKFLISNFLRKISFFSHIYVIIVVLVSWLIFSTSDISLFMMRLKGMFLIDTPLTSEYTKFLFKESLVIFIVGIIFSTPLYRKVQKITVYKKLVPFILVIIMITSTAFIVDSSFNPFLYFRF